MSDQERELSGKVVKITEGSFKGQDGNEVPTFTAMVQTPDGEFEEVQAFKTNPFTKGEELEAIVKPNSNPKYAAKYLRRKGEAPKSKGNFGGSYGGSKVPEDKSGVTAGMLTNKAVEAVLAGKELIVADIVTEGLKILEANTQILNAVKALKAKTETKKSSETTPTQKLPNSGDF